MNNIGLDTILFFVPAGSVLPLGPVVQYSDALPGGPLNVYVFPGADGAFNMTEDDGETTDYEQGALRSIAFTWNHLTETLSWVVAGTFSDAHTFVQISATLMDPAGVKQSSVRPLDQTGSIQFV